MTCARCLRACDSARILCERCGKIADDILRECARSGRTPRYIVRCGLEASGKVVVWDAFGGWLCSRHKSLALAQKRAAELNASVA